MRGRVFDVQGTLSECLSAWVEARGGSLSAVLSFQDGRRQRCADTLWLERVSLSQILHQTRLCAMFNKPALTQPTDGPVKDSDEEEEDDDVKGTAPAKAARTVTGKSGKGQSSEKSAGKDDAMDVQHDEHNEHETAPKHKSKKQAEPHANDDDDEGGNEAEEKALPAGPRLTVKLRGLPFKATEVRVCRTNGGLMIWRL